MVRFALMCCTTAALAVQCSDSAFAAAPSLKEQVLSEYPRALARMQEFFAHVKGSATLTIDGRLGSPNPFNDRFRIYFARNGAMTKIDRWWIGDDAKASRKKTLAQVAWCSNPRYSFQLRREAPQAPLLLNGLGAEPDWRNEVQESTAMFLEQYLHAPYTVFGLPIIQMMAHRTFALKDVTEEHQAPDRLFKIDYQFEPDDFVVRSGTLWVAPRNNWTLQRCVFQMGTAERHAPVSGSVEYADIKDNAVFVPKRVVYTYAPADKPTGWRHTFEVEDIAAESVSAREFTLSAFGLPEIPPASTEPSHTPYWLFGAAAVLLALGATLRYWARSRRSIARLQD